MFSKSDRWENILNLALFWQQKDNEIYERLLDLCINLVKIVCISDAKDIIEKNLGIKDFTKYTQGLTADNKLKDLCTCYT